MPKVISCGKTFEFDPNKSKVFVGEKGELVVITTENKSKIALFSGDYAVIYLEDRVKVND